MTPERKKYLKQCSLRENAIRSDIKDNRKRIRFYKEQLNDGGEYVEQHILLTRWKIAEIKRYIAFLKRQLPQRLPPGKLKRCPFCGGEAEEAGRAIALAYCKACGAVVAAKTWNKRK